MTRRNMEPPNPRPARPPLSPSRIAALLGVLFLSLYLLTMGGHTSSSDEETIYYVTRSLVNHGGLEAADYPADPPLNGMRGVDGRFYGHTGLLPSIMAVPFYAVGNWVSWGFSPEFQPYLTRFFVGLLDPVVTALTCSLVFLFCLELRYPVRVAVLVTAAYGLATMAWPYSKYCWSEPITAGWLLFAVYAAFLAVHREKWGWYLASGAALGLAAASKMTALAVLPGLIAYLLLAGRKGQGAGRGRGLGLTVFCAALLVPLAGIAWANEARFGGIFKAGYDEWSGPSPVQLSNYRGILGLLISPGKSVFLYSPVIVVSVLLFGYFWSRFRAEALLLAFASGVHLVLAGLFTHWHGDAAWGPRYLMPITAFLVIPAGAALAWSSGPWRKLTWCLFVVAFCGGVAVNVGGVLVNYGTYISRSGGPFGALAERRRWEPARSPILVHWNLLAQRVDKLIHQKAPEALFEAGFFPSENRKGRLYPRWTDGNATIKAPLKGGRSLRFSVRYWEQRPPSAGPTVVELTYNGRKCDNPEADIDPATGIIRVSALVQISPDDGPEAMLGIRSNTWTPAEHADTDDRRSLGVFLKDIRLRVDEAEVSVGPAFIHQLPISQARPWSGEAFAWFYQPETELYHPTTGWGFDLWLWHLYYSGLPRWMLGMAAVPWAGLLFSAVLLIRAIRGMTAAPLLTDSPAGC
jgi:hypothetical protein